jgi:hypothetical protein
VEPLGRRGSSLNAVVLGLAIGAGLATTCGDGIYVVNHYALEPCARPDYALPDSASDGTYAVSSDIPKAYRKGDLDGGKVFLLTKGTRKEHYFEARLDPSSSCSLEVAWGYVGKASNPDLPREHENNERADIVARLLTVDANVKPKEPADSIERRVNR